MRALNVLMAVLFFLSAALQYNDPDPIGWICIYSAAAIVSLWAAIRRVPLQIPAVVGAVALVWALTLLPRLVGKPIIWSQVFGAIEMANTVVEEVRETGGLLIITIWMAILSFYSSRGKR
jgi:hypothetical protein